MKPPTDFYKTTPALLTRKLEACSVVSPKAMTAAVRPFAAITGTLAPKRDTDDGRPACYYYVQHGAYLKGNAPGDDIVFISWRSYPYRTFTPTGQDTAYIRLTAPTGVNAAWFDGVAFVFSYPYLTIRVGISGDSSFMSAPGSATVAHLDAAMANLVIPAVTRCFLRSC